MSYSDRIVTLISKAKEKSNVGIYCRVSSKSAEQMHSLSTQLSALTQLVYDTADWKMRDVYIDIASGSNTSMRSGFNRMLDDCREGKLDIVVTKSISRFGRDTVSVLSAVQELVDLGVRVCFDDLGLSVNSPSDRLLISVAAAVAQGENQARSESIRWGIERKVSDGSSSLYDRKCYGYSKDVNGILQIDDEQSAVVKLIFELYLSGYSILRILSELEHRGIKSPTGKDRWCKHTVECMLKNEKYTGDVIVFKSYSTLTKNGSLTRKENTTRTRYTVEYNNPVIITREEFNLVQEEMRRRSNVTVTEDGKTVRSSKRYSSKEKTNSIE